MRGGQRDKSQTRSLVKHDSREEWSDSDGNFGTKWTVEEAAPPNHFPPKFHIVYIVIKNWCNTLLYYISQVYTWYRNPNINIREVGQSTRTGVDWTDPKPNNGKDLCMEKLPSGHVREILLLWKGDCAGWRWRLGCSVGSSGFRWVLSLNNISCKEVHMTMSHGI